MKKPLLIILLLLIFIISGISFLVVKSSRDVVSAFGKMDETLRTNNFSVEKENDSLLLTIKDEGLLLKANRVDSLVTDFSNYVVSIKEEMLGEIDTQNYEVMEERNNMFFTENGLSKNGMEFIVRINRLREALLVITENPELKTNIANTFGTGQVYDRNGRRRDWLAFNFKDVPLIVSVTKLTQIQSDITLIEKSIFLDYLEE